MVKRGEIVRARTPVILTRFPPFGLGNGAARNSGLQGAALLQKWRAYRNRLNFPECSFMRLMRHMTCRSPMETSPASTPFVSSAVTRISRRAGERLSDPPQSIADLCLPLVEWHEGALAAAAADAAIGDDETDDARIEINHLRYVAGVNAAMRQLRANRCAPPEAEFTRIDPAIQS